MKSAIQTCPDKSPADRADVFSPVTAVSRKSPTVPNTGNSRGPEAHPIPQRASNIGPHAWALGRFVNRFMLLTAFYLSIASESNL
jgi:hypothetical protein